MIAISTHLGLPPFQTLAGGNLWNYKLLDPNRSIQDPDNLEAQFTFTGSDNESWFYVSLIAIEARGGPIISLALRAFTSVLSSNSPEVTSCLQEMAGLIYELGSMLPRMYERCDPQFFYNRIRPFLAGTKGSSDLPKGLFYEDGTGGGEYYQYVGPSAVQSSLLQFIDAALGVSHIPIDSPARKAGLANQVPVLENKSEHLLHV